MFILFLWTLCIVGMLLYTYSIVHYYTIKNKEMNEIFLDLTFFLLFSNFIALES